MKHIDFYFDVISPYAYLAFEHLPMALQGISHSVAYKPVLFAAMLKHHGQLGPAEIEPKKRWTFQQVAWLANQHGIPITAPAAHPFNPLPLLRMMLAIPRPEVLAGTCSRAVAQAVFRHVWARPTSVDVVAPAAVAELQTALGHSTDSDAARAKTLLQKNSDEALALGLFGVPSMVCDGQVFWGLDALPMLKAYLLDDPWFSGVQWHGDPPNAAVARVRSA